MSAKRNGPQDKRAVSQPMAAVFGDPSIAPAPDGLVSGTLVLVAVIQVRGDHEPTRYRRRTFFNLRSAQRAVDRAVQDGLDAHLLLCQLRPIGGDSDE